MASVDGGNPSGLSEAAEGSRYVRAAVEELESLQRELPALLHMEWRSEAADEFAEFLHQCRQRLGATVRELEVAAELLRRYAEELRLSIGRDG